MRLFVTVVDAGSLSAAGRLCGLSLASVSRHIDALESRVGAKLLVRTTRRLVLTDAGQAYEQSARRLLAEMDELETRISAKASLPAGRIQIAAPTLFGREHLLPTLARFMYQYPETQLDVTLLDRPVNLLEEGFDLALVVGALEDSTLVARHLGAIRWVFCASPHYLAVRGTPTTEVDLHSHDALVYGQHSMASEWPLKSGSKVRHVRVQVRMRCNTLDGVITGALEHCGIAYVPYWAVRSAVMNGRLMLLMQEREVAPRPLHAVFTHSRLLSAKIRAVVEYIATDMRKQDFASALPINTEASLSAE